MNHGQTQSTLAVFLRHAALFNNEEEREWDPCWLLQQLREGGSEDAPLPQTGKKQLYHVMGTPTAKRPRGAPGYFSTSFCQATHSQSEVTETFLHKH